MTAVPQPHVTIAMSMRNAARTIGTALRSLEHQTLQGWELVLVDDGSSDETLAVAKGFGDPRIRIVADGQMRGLASRLNQTIDIARGRYFARMDADDICYPQRLERQLAFLERHPDVDLVGTGMMVFDALGQPIGVYPAQTDHEGICARPYSGFHMAHPSWMGRLDWFRRWRYDPRWMKAQDQELLLRAYRSSRFAAISELLMGYRQEKVSIGKSAISRWYLARAVWQAARRERRRVAGAFAISLQVGKVAYDALAVSTGLERRMLRHRALPATAAEIETWMEVWTRCAG